MKDSCCKKGETETTKFNQPQNKMRFHPPNHRTLFTLQSRLKTVAVGLNWLTWFVSEIAAAVRCETLQTRCGTHLMSGVESLFLSGAEMVRRIVASGSSQCDRLHFHRAAGSSVGEGGAPTHQPDRRLPWPLLSRNRPNARFTTETCCCPPSAALRGDPATISGLRFQKYFESQQHRGSSGAFISAMIKAVSLTLSTQCMF